MEATAELARLLAAEPAAMPLRLKGYATLQARAPFEEARPDFEAALTAARAAEAPYEIALTLRALAELGGADGTEADTILEQLGVVALPHIPLP